MAKTRENCSGIVGREKVETRGKAERSDINRGANERSQRMEKRTRLDCLFERRKRFARERRNPKRGGIVVSKEAT